MKSENKKLPGIESLSEICEGMFSQTLVRQVQDQGFMLPARITVGSHVIFLY